MNQTSRSTKQSTLSPNQSSRLPRYYPISTNHTPLPPNQYHGQPSQRKTASGFRRKRTGDLSLHEHSGKVYDQVRQVHDHWQGENEHERRVYDQRS
ncbi:MULTISPECIES: hypothetical protein, partial [unclassified Sporosarcina]|uniref:hypothetical protein n=1 Tax=unclassified Sporosarcina TaxID=2647733 RepID=UPI00203C9118